MGLKVPKRFKIAFIVGTRPEIIKTAPVYLAIAHQPDLQPVFINTGQHKEMSHMFLDLFNITPDYELNIMKPKQSLSSLTASILQELEIILQREKPDWVFVQGDTTSAFCGALSAFYQKITIGHIEAGLRTGDIYSPFPEEMNRILVGRLSTYHFAPTQKAKNNLLSEGISPDKIIITGNTVVDALHWIQAQDKKISSPDISQLLSSNPIPRIVLVTAHRRENWEGGIANVAKAVIHLAKRFPDIIFIFSVHPNPVVKKQVYAILSHQVNVLLHNPLDYFDFIKVLSQSLVAISDSGGVQEEAPSLGVPVIITRSTTERPEILETGMGYLAGTDQATIINLATEILTQERTRKAQSIFGDGFASQRIVQSLLFTFGKMQKKPDEFYC
ncbi:MAG: UDP-N-acetylglucosamine 2-epimerase (non-hydrolyzing) [Candidatus Atribacteria bacterium]|nr:UDP-N-acetylglucosamine 2-epimerase (non-hydrolyzing) [Candidatus Atribacteria bacterium]